MFLLELAGGLQVHAPQALKLIGRRDLANLRSLFFAQVGVLVELGGQALHLFEQVDELAACGVALEVSHILRHGAQTLRLHEVGQLLLGRLQAGDDLGRRVHQPDLARIGKLLAGEQGDGLVHRLLLLAEVEDIAVGLAVVEYAVGAIKGLDQAVVLEVLVHVQGVEVLGIKTREQHVDDDGDVDLLGLRQVGIGVLLILDALLHILVVEVEFRDTVVAAKAGVVVVDDGFECGLLTFWVLLVVLLFLRQVFLNLLHVLVALSRWREHAGEVQWPEVFVDGQPLDLRQLEAFDIVDGIVDAGGGQHSVELAPVGGGVVLGEDGLDDLLFGQRLAGLGWLLALGLEVVHMKLEDVAVFNGVGDGVLVQAALEQVVCRAVAGLLTFNLLIAGVLLEDGRAGEAKQLRLGKERFDGLVVVAKLRAVAFVEDEHHALAAQGFEALLVVAPGVAVRAGLAAVQCQAQLLDGGDDDLVGIVV